MFIFILRFVCSIGTHSHSAVLAHALALTRSGPLSHIILPYVCECVRMCMSRLTAARSHQPASQLSSFALLCFVSFRVVRRFVCLLACLHFSMLNRLVAFHSLLWQWNILWNIYPTYVQLYERPFPKMLNACSIFDQFSLVSLNFNAIFLLYQLNNCRFCRRDDVWQNCKQIMVLSELTGCSIFIGIYHLDR